MDDDTTWVFHVLFVIVLLCLMGVVANTYPWVWVFPAIGLYGGLIVGVSRMVWKGLASSTVRSPRNFSEEGWDG